MKLVIDFSGFYLNQKFIIREFSIFQIDGISVTASTVVTDISSYVESLSHRSDIYRKFRSKYGIPNRVDGSVEFDTLQDAIKNLMQYHKTVYLRNKEQLKKLTSFCSTVLLYKHKVKLLSNSNFDDTYEVLKTSCTYHDSRFSYCATDNARLMTKWVVAQRISKLNLRKDMLLTLNFNGYYDSNNVFRVKELSVYGINYHGIVLYKRLFVITPKPDFSRAINEDNEAKYYSTYYNKFGIHYSNGNYDYDQFSMKIRKTFQKYDINIVYVSDKHQSSLVKYIIPDINIEVVSLSDYSYSETVDINEPMCLYHTNIDQSKNVCALSKGRRMLKWIIDSEFYKLKIRNCLYEISNGDINIHKWHYIHDDTVLKFITDDLNELPVIDTDDLNM